MKKLEEQDLEKLKYCRGKCQGCLEEDDCELKLRFDKYPYLKEKIPKINVIPYKGSGYTKPKNDSKPLRLK